MAKQTGPFFPAQIRKVLKAADCIACEVAPCGDIYITEGRIVLVLAPNEYDTIVRPVTQRDPGNWRIKQGLLEESKLKISDTLVKCYAASRNDLPLVPTGLYWRLGDNNWSRGYYDTYYRKPALFNAGFTECFAPDCELRMHGYDGAIVANYTRTLGMIYPIRMRDPIKAAIQALYDAGGVV